MNSLLNCCEIKLIINLITSTEEVVEEVHKVLLKFFYPLNNITETSSE